MTWTVRVLFLMPHPIEGPSSRFRVYQYIPYLRDHGVDATVRPFFSSNHIPHIYGDGRLAKKLALTGLATVRRGVDVLQAPGYDIVYVLREAFPFGPPLLEHLLKFAAGRLVFDFDDAIYLPSLAYRNPLDRLRDWDKPGKVVRLATHIVAGSGYLADYARKFTNDENKISVIPTVVDTNVYRPSEPRDARHGLTIGWIGTPRGSSYLRDLLPVIREVGRRYPRINFKFVGAEPFDVQGLPITFETWRLDKEVSDIQSFDIGVMPLTDDEETRGKCGFKLIQYMSMGVPSICSPVGANKEIVEHGKSGFFAESEQEWLEALSALIEDPARMRKMGQAGRDRAVAYYSLEAMGPKLLEVLSGAMGRSERRRHRSKSI